MATICYNQIMRFGITRRQIKPNKPTRTGIVVRVFPCGNTQSGLQCYRITKETTWGWLGKTTMGCGLCYFQITWLWLSEATYKVVQISPISRLGWWMGVISIVFMGIINQRSHHYGGTTKKTTRYPRIGIQGAKSSGSRPAEFVSVKKTTWAIDEPTSDQHSATHNIPPPQKKGCRTSVNIP